MFFFFFYIQRRSSSERFFTPVVTGDSGYADADDKQLLIADEQPAGERRADDGCASSAGLLDADAGDNEHGMPERGDTERLDDERQHDARSGRPGREQRRWLPPADDELQQQQQHHQRHEETRQLRGGSDDDDRTDREAGEQEPPALHLQEQQRSVPISGISLSAMRVSVLYTLKNIILLQIESPHVLHFCA